MPQLVLQLLGTFQATLDNQPITGFESNKVRALLAYLAVEADCPHSRDELIGLLWPEQPDKAARANLRQALNNLRQVLGDRASETPFLSATVDSVLFNHIEQCSIDVVTFTEMLAACQAHLHRRLETCRSCAHRLQQAVEQYRGDFLSSFMQSGSEAFEEWALIQRERLHRKMLDALYVLAEHHDRRGEYDHVRRYAARQLELDPWREEAHRQLMRALALTGQRSAALAQYETCRRVLTEALGTEPSKETTALCEQIKADTLTRADQRHNLPAVVTPLIGREHELAEIDHLLETPACRLLTLTGLGGIGKTRLALHAGAEHIGAFTHGVFFVSLAPLTSADLIVPAIADALQFAFFGQQDPKLQLLNYLREKEMLLILDNFEQIRDGVTLLSEILRSAPTITLLVTSRERLDLQGEWGYNLQGLPFPPDGAVDDGERYSAIELFVQSAQRAHSDFSLTMKEMPDVAQICRLVEGMPLALELAAAWVRVISCYDIAHEIERGLSVLTTTWPDVPERHRSLWAVFEHSWRLMSDAEQTTFRKLAVFRGGFDRAAAEDVTGASLSLLAALVDKSLLRRDSAGRYTLHELVRQYADEKLTELHEREQVQSRHLDHFLRFAAEGEPELHRANQVVWLDRFEIEYHNLRMALDWSIRYDVERGLKLALALAEYWLRRDYISEGQVAFSSLLDSTNVSYYPLLKARILEKAGTFAQWYSDLTTARGCYESSLVICNDLGDSSGIANALSGLGFIALCQSDVTSARRLLEEALAIQRDLSDLPGMAETLFDLGDTEITADNYLIARSLCMRSLAIFKEIGDHWSVARVLQKLGTVALVLGDLITARQYDEESLAINRLIRCKAGIVESLASLGEVCAIQGELTQAYSLGEECIGSAHELGDRYGTVWALGVQGQVANLYGSTQLARLLLEERLSISESLGQDEYVAWTRFQLGQVEICADEMAAAKQQFAEGLTLFQKVGTKEGIAWSLHGLACIAVLEKDTLQASRLLEECLATFQALGIRDGVAKTLRSQGDVALQRAAPSEALVLYRCGLDLHREMGAKLDSVEDMERLAHVAATMVEPKRAARLFGAAAALRETLGAPRPSVDHTRYGSAIAEIRAHVDKTSFESAWAEGQAMTIEQAVEYALQA